jgi:hypothetical protein
VTPRTLPHRRLGRSSRPYALPGWTFPAGDANFPGRWRAIKTVVVTIDGRRRKLTKREAIVTQMVDKSASADLRATKMLIDMMKDVEHKAGGVASPPPEPRRLAAADKEVVQQFVARLRRQILQEIEEKVAEPPG